MSLLETIRHDQVEARKARDQISIGLLTSLLSEAAMVGKTKANRESTDEEVIATIKKFLKNAEETLGLVPTGSAKDKVQIEIDLLNHYLPQQLTEGQLRTEILGFIAAQGGKTSMGPIMAMLKQNHAGLYDGKRASALAKELLG